MFSLLSNGFKEAALKLKGQSTLTEENLASALQTVRKALLDADVELGVTKDFLTAVKEKSLGEVVKLKSSSGKKVRPDDHFIQICHAEMTTLLGGESTEIIKNPKGPTVILLAGLQGAGKTTHAAKLAKLLSANPHKMRPLLVAADVYRPAARDQLKTLGQQLDIPVFSMDDSTDAVEIARQGVAFAREEWRDLVIVDTAGRLTIDNTLMTELKNIKTAIQPQNTLLVIDAMIGQDAVRTAKTFHDSINLTGVILTKLDGDTRGGAALSVKKITGKSILFIGTGEQLEKLEEFRPEGMASRILGMGDVLSLMDDFQKSISEEDLEKQQKRLLQGEFDFNDMETMLGSIGKMGSAQDIMAKMPMMGGMDPAAMAKDADMKTPAAIIRSMTKQERKNPHLLLQNKSSSAKSRIKRIAQGSAKPENAVKDLVDKFFQMKGMMDMFRGMNGGGGFDSKIPGLGQLKKLSGMAKMAKMMGSGDAPSGMGGLSQMFCGGGFPGEGDGQGFSTSQIAQINRLKKQKKAEKLRKQKKKK